MYGFSSQQIQHLCPPFQSLVSMTLIRCVTKGEISNVNHHRTSNSSQKKPKTKQTPKLNKEMQSFHNAFHLKITVPSASDDSSVLAPSILAAMFTILRMASKKENSSTRALSEGPENSSTKKFAILQYLLEINHSVRT